MYMDIQRSQMPEPRRVIMAARGVLNQLSKGGILLIRRSQDASNPGTWELPGGTGLPTDISPESILAREFGEETGINICTNKCLGVWTQCDTRAPNQDGIFMTFIYTVSFVLSGCSPDSPERTVVLSNEHDNFAWVEPNQASLSEYRLHPDSSSAVNEYIENMRQVRLSIHKGAAIQRSNI